MTLTIDIDILPAASFAIPPEDAKYYRLTEYATHTIQYQEDQSKLPPEEKLKVKNSSSSHSEEEDEMDDHNDSSSSNEVEVENSKDIIDEQEYEDSRKTVVIKADTGKQPMIV